MISKNGLKRKVSNKLKEICTQALNAYALALFDQYLKSQPAPLLNGPSPDYGYVRYESK